MKSFTTAAAVIALMSASAFAQDATPPPPANPPAAQDTTPAPTPSITTPDSTVENSKSMSDGQWRSSKLVGVTVRNGANESIGDINDLIVDNSGKITAVVVGVGGFLGMGEKLVSLTFDQLSISRDSNNMLVVMANATKESLEAAPEWKDPTKAPTMAR